MRIEPLLSELVWSPTAKPYAHWQDSGGCEGTILATQEKLQAFGIPPAASHQFQHSYLGTSIHPDEHADYPYDIRRVGTSRLLDFFYSGVIDAAHEPEDFALYLSRLGSPPEHLPGIYASCDYHYGPETLHEVLRQHEDEVIGLFCQLLIQHLSIVGRIACVLLRWKPEYVLGVIERRLPAVFEALKGVPPLQFAAEQLSHSTYVFVGDQLSADGVIQALREGRTCVTRGAAEFRGLQPVSSNVPSQASRVQLQFDLPTTYSVHRPRSVLIYRDGALVDWLTIPDQQQAVSITWADPAPPKGVHNYVVYIPSKFLSSPIVLDIQ